MSPEDPEKLKRILLRACDLPPSARAAFLDEACEGDAELRVLADALLGARSGIVEPTETDPAAPEPAEASRNRRLKAGDLIDDKYRIEAPIGAGGMGEVYLARQLVLNRVVAIKVLPTDAHAGSGRRFQREALAVGRLHHPNIVTVHDLGLAPGLGAYLVMEFVNGRSLADELHERERLPIPEAVELMRQVCAGVAAAHAAGMIHRDLKPGNILLERVGQERRAKVADFGLAKLVEEDSPVEPLTVTGALVGTPHYMSPEQCLGEAFDARSDVYALGCILYEMVAGVRPFTAPTALALLQKHVSAAPTPLRALVPGASAELEQVVARALAKQPGDRWRTAAAFSHALATLVPGEGITSAPAPAAPDPRTGAEAADDSVQTAMLAAESGIHAEAAAPPTNVPHPATRCIGRDRELERIASTLGNPQVRLLTLTGAGGTGKTRLAYEAARVLLPHFPDGVFAVELAGLADPSLVASHIVSALGVREAPGGSPAEALVRHLANKRILLVLDNFEHVVEAAPVLAELLAGAPAVKLLVTSRALLHLSHEHEIAVDPLEVPSAYRLSDLATLAQMPAVALFVERAREAKATFAFAADNARAVVEICRRLDGLPLAIELAAARVKLFAPQALLGGLEHRLKLLVGGARDLPVRQQTIRSTVQWSFDLLDASEREVLCRLAVFAGGCDFEAAEAVCAEAGLDVFDGIGSLVDKSLLRQQEQADAESRFGMLDLVREFALEQLEAGGWAESARGAHAAYFLRVAEEARPELDGPEQSVFLKRLGREHDNLRAALAYLLESAPEQCGRLASALADFWDFRSHFTEGKSWFDRALNVEGAPSAARAWLLFASGRMRWRLGDLEGATAHARDGLAMARVLGEHRIAARALNVLGIVAMVECRYAEARTYLTDALATAREHDMDDLRSDFLINLGEVERSEGNVSGAARFYEQAIEALGRGRPTMSRVVSVVNLAAVRLEQGDLDEACARYREAIASAQQVGSRYYITLGIDGLAAIAVERLRMERAAKLSGAAEAEYEELGMVLEPLEAAARARYVEKLSAALDPTAFELEWARGRSMGLDAAVAEALRDD